MPKPFLLVATFLIAAAVFAQQTKVTGMVKDKLLGVPLMGATIQSKNGAAITNNEGAFSINAAIGEMLRFSFIGRKPVIVEVKSFGVLTIALEMASNDLNTVVITGYQAQLKIDLIGSIAVVDMTPIKNNTSGNPMQALQGRVAGLYIEKNGNPNGENTRLLIRGLNTMGNSDPLYIIDGVPTKRSIVFQSLDAGVIESVQILKDASAGSIYGSRASNGVIIVTTRNANPNEGSRLGIQINTGLTYQTVKPH